MNEEEKQAVEEFRKQLRLAINIDDVATTIRNDDAKIILNLIEKMKNCIHILDDELKERNKTIKEKEILIDKLQKENEELKRLHIQDNKHLDFIMEHSIPVQKVKDKIEELKQQNIFTTIDFIKTTPQDIKNTVIQELQELQEWRK